jgi:hypothetical protein
VPKPPLWFTLLAGLALLWNLAGLLAVVADLRLSAADIAALPAEQQAMYAARPLWSVVASVVAVAAGTLGCLALLLRRRWSLALLYLSLAGVLLQDIGIFLVAGAARTGNPVPLVLQSLVLVIAIGLIALARRATARSWLS